MAAERFESEIRELERKMLCGRFGILLGADGEDAEGKDPEDEGKDPEAGGKNPKKKKKWRGLREKFFGKDGGGTFCERWKFEWEILEVFRVRKRKHIEWT